MFGDEDGRIELVRFGSKAKILGANTHSETTTGIRKSQGKTQLGEIDQYLSPHVGVVLVSGLFCRVECQIPKSGQKSLSYTS